MRPRSQLKTVRARASALELKNEKASTLQTLTGKKRSKSSPTQSSLTNTMDPSIIRFKLSPRKREQDSRSPQHKYTDQAFFYKNLHNQRLWKWQHPMDYCELKKTPQSRPCKVNLSVLGRFRDYMEKRVGKRVPLVVQDILTQTKNKF